MSREERPRYLQVLLYGYVAALWAILLVALTHVWHLPGRGDLPLLAAFTVMSYAARRWRLDLYGRGNFSVRIAVAAAAAIALGPTVGALLGIIGVLYTLP